VNRGRILGEGGKLVSSKREEKMKENMWGFFGKGVKEKQQ